jgi:hypothetical protein
MKFSWRTFFALGILLLAARNLSLFYLDQKESGVPSLSEAWKNSPGSEFLPLTRDILHERIIGYLPEKYDADIWVDVETMKPFEQAQYALSPVVLDLHTPLRHDKVLVVCRRDVCWEDLLKEKKYRILNRLSDKIVLIEQVK